MNPVAIRMRPLNKKESKHPGSKGVWRTLPKYHSVAQTTEDGRPLPERVVGRNFFTYDRAFGGKSTNSDVYDGVVRDVVRDALGGRNGAVFAYGQTSSGKTYTMQGGGDLSAGGSDGNGNGNGNGGADGGGGILHLAAEEIFRRAEELRDQRAFLVRVSFLEVYNEEVRDLLHAGGGGADGDDRSNVLAIREDPRRGPFVNCHEAIVSDAASLVGTLFAGERNRHVGSTVMNLRSSRSHTIFRVTIESRSREADGEGQDGGNNGEEEEDDAFLRGPRASSSGSSVLVSTLNLVDLAGSESVRHTGATGDRQKEGGMINQSLLTLSRVISSLAARSQDPGADQFVNYRDSKLTRLLQPSLGGNARMAVICCATPSGMYLEETRSTLLFASRAKLVRTHATVNEVVDDRSLIRQLQRDLAEARRAARKNAESGAGAGAEGDEGSDERERMMEAEREAAASREEARLAEDRLRRLKVTIGEGFAASGGLAGLLGMGLRTGMGGTYRAEERDRIRNLGGGTASGGGNGWGSDEATREAQRRRRRRSDGGILGRPGTAAERGLLPATPAQGGRRVRFGSGAGADEDGGSAEAEDAAAAKAPAAPRTAVKPARGSVGDEPAVPLAAELELLRTALSAKGRQARDLREALAESRRVAEVELSGKAAQLAEMGAAREAAETRTAAIADERDHALAEREAVESEGRAALEAKEAAVADALAAIGRTLEEKREADGIADGLRSELEEAARGKAEAEATLEEARAQMLAMGEENQEMLVKLEQDLAERASAHEAEIGEMEAALDDERAERQTEIEGLRTELEVDRALIGDLESAKSGLEERVETVEEHARVAAAEAASERSELVANIKSLELDSDNTKDAFEARVADLTTERDALAKQLKEVSSKLETSAVEWTGRHEQAKAELDNLTAEKEEIAKSLAGANAALTEERDELTSRAYDLQAQVDLLNKGTAQSALRIEEVSNELQSTRVLLAEKEAEAAALRETAATLKSTEASASDLIQEVTASLSEAKESNHCLLGEKATLETRIAELTESSEGVQEAHDALSEKNIEMAMRLAELEEEKAQELSELKAAKALAEEEARNAVAAAVNSITEIEAAHESAQGTISELRSECDSANAKIAELAERVGNLSPFENQVKDLQDQLIEKERVFEMSRKEIDEVRSQSESVLEELEKAQSQVVSLSEGSEENQQLQEQVLELTQLLAAANDSVEEARSAALAADEELSEKEELFEQSQRLNSELERNLLEASTRAEEFERLLAATNNGREDDMMRDMELLMQDKVESDSRLKREQEDRKKSEDELKRRMGEEQRILINEAEANMSILRDELTNLRADYDAAKASMIAATEEAEQMRDRLGSRDSAAGAETDRIMSELTAAKEAEVRMSEELMQLREESEQFRARVFAAKESLEEQAGEQITSLRGDLQEALEGRTRAESEVHDLARQNKNALNERDMSLSKLREEVCEVKISLSIKDAEVHEVREKMRREHERVTSNLKEQLAASALERNEALSSQANAAGANKKSLAEIKKLQKELKRRDARIQKLEDVKLTKEQVVALKKMKEERVQYLRERDELLEQLDTLRSSQDKENTGVSTRSTRSGDAALNKEKVALEKKLVKYAKHVQSLEAEKAEISDALRGLGDSGIHSTLVDDVPGAVISLADRLKTSEADVEILTSEQKRAQGYLMELDRLREDNANLDRTLRRTENENRRMGELEAELVELRRDKAELKTVAMSARESSVELKHEQQRQVKYLENENLSLMMELKAIKQDLHSAKSSMHALQQNGVGTRGGIDMEGNDDTIDLMGIADASSMAKILSSSGSSPSDKENSRNRGGGKDSTPGGGTDYATKGKSGFSSVKKSLRMRGATPAKASAKLGGGLGEVDDEHTGECNQS